MFRHIVLSRADLRRISPSALRALRDGFGEVYRDEEFSVLTRGPAPDYRSAEWPELLARLEMDEKDDEILVILNVWKRGPELLRRQIEGVLAQTVPVKEIWVCAFGVSDADAYEAVLKEFTGAPLHFFRSSKNLKYHGRFQLALQTDAQYVAFIDDDILVGPEFLRICRDTLERTLDAGEVGLYGWRRSPGPDDDGRIARYTRGEFIEHLPPERRDTGLVEADLLCGFHMLRQKHIRYLFRDEAWTMATGEDFQIAFALRKYLGLKSYVAPVDPSDSATWGLSRDWLDVRFNASTTGDADAVRDALYWKLINRGNPVSWMKEKATSGEGFTLAAFSNVAEARAAQRALKGGEKGLALFCGPSAKADEAISAFGLHPGDQVDHRVSWFDLALPTSGPAREEDASASFGALLKAMRPAAFFVPAGDEALAAAAKRACEEASVPLILTPLA